MPKSGHEKLVAALREAGLSKKKKTTQQTLGDLRGISPSDTHLVDSARLKSHLGSAGHDTLSTYLYVRSREINERTSTNVRWNDGDMIEQKAS